MAMNSLTCIRGFYVYFFLSSRLIYRLYKQGIVLIFSSETAEPS